MNSDTYKEKRQQSCTNENITSNFMGAHIMCTYNQCNHSSWESFNSEDSKEFMFTGMGYLEVCAIVKIERQLDKTYKKSELCVVCVGQRGNWGG